MTEPVKQVLNNQAASVAAPEPAQATPEKPVGNSDIAIVGRFDKYRSSYWAGMMAALGMRYAPRPFWRSNFEAPADKVSHFDKHKYSGFAGVILSGVAGLYAVKTYSDIKTIFAETVGWELGKAPKDVNFIDFWKSKNSIVRQTMNNYVKFNARRFGVNAVYFTPFIFKKSFQKHNLTGEAGIDFGVAANAAYLLHDILRRKMTPFEEVQALIDTKINHAEHFTDPFVATDLLDIYERHAEHSGGKNKSFMAHRGTLEWEDSIALFQRMADLMNQSYQNEVPHEHAQFGFSKFITLLGNDLIDPDQIDRTRALVEIVNRYGAEELQKAAAECKKDVALNTVMKRYPLADEAMNAATVIQDAPQVPAPRESSRSKIVQKGQQEQGFVEKQAERMANAAVSQAAI